MRIRTSFLVVAMGFAAGCGSSDSGSNGAGAGSGAGGATGTAASGAGTTGTSAAGSGAGTGSAGAGSGSGTGGMTGATSGESGTASGAAGASSSGAGSQSGSTGPADASTAKPEDASASHDAAAVHADATVPAGDGGAAPYKGVGGNSDCQYLPALGVTWNYNWEATPGCTQAPFVPMVWGKGAELTAAGITKEVATAVSSGYAYVLGFNEPDNSSQSNIDVDTAISLWPSFNNPSILIGSPATQGNSTGMTWFTSFMDKVNGDTTGTLRVDFIAAHWYGWNSGSCDSKASNLESYLKQIEAIPGNRPIWLTEWGCLNDSNPSEAVVQAFYEGALTMFANHPRLVRYGWYQWETNNELVNDDGGGLTSLGETFAMEPGTK
ncbi:MAG TPA: glycosyl hydrolase [Polyangiaceae bacterium]|nr:glycosyl hydrolase [Polyangiaceae bacterium]